jgi:hypothetical protein
MTPEELKAFKTDLRALLEKHNASIGVNLDGDLEGVYTDFAVGFKGGFGPDHIIASHKSWIDAKDIK